MIGDRSRGGRRAAPRESRLTGLLLAVVCAAAVLVAAVAAFQGVSVPSAVSARSSAGVPGPPEPKPASTSASPTASTRAGALGAARVGEAHALLVRQAKALQDRDRERYLATIDPRSRGFARVAAQTFDNLAAMGATDIRFGEPVEDTGAVTPDRRRVLGRTAWVAEVDLTFRLGGSDTGSWTSSLRMVFVERDGETYLAGDREGQSSTGPVPLWLTDKVSVVVGERSLVIGTGEASRLEPYAHTADRAVPRVSRVWGDDWPEAVVVVVPSSRLGMERVIGAEPGTQKAVAAVTTSVGRADPTVASHIVVNPETYTRVGSLGRLVVLTHESTHVAAHATVSSMPVWLSEGFADYVGFREAGLPVSVVAQEFFAEVRRTGPPGELPEGSEFDPQARNLDQAYESAWSACRYVVDEWDEADLVALYRAMDDATSEAAEAQAYDRILDTTPGEFVSGWRRYVEARASGG